MLADQRHCAGRALTSARMRPPALLAAVCACLAVTVVVTGCGGGTKLLHTAAAQTVTIGIPSKTPQAAQKLESEPVAHHSVFIQQARNGPLRRAVRNIHIHAIAAETMVRNVERDIYVSRRDDD